MGVACGQLRLGSRLGLRMGFWDRRDRSQGSSASRGLRREPGAARLRGREKGGAGGAGRGLRLRQGPGPRRRQLSALLRIVQGSRALSPLRILKEDQKKHHGGRSRQAR